MNACVSVAANVAGDFGQKMEGPSKGGLGIAGYCCVVSKQLYTSVLQNVGELYHDTQQRLFCFQK